MRLRRDLKEDTEFACLRVQQLRGPDSKCQIILNYSLYYL